MIFLNWRLKVLINLLQEAFIISFFGKLQSDLRNIWTELLIKYPANNYNKNIRKFVKYVQSLTKLTPFSSVSLTDIGHNCFLGRYDSRVPGEGFLNIFISSFNISQEFGYKIISCQFITTQKCYAGLFIPHGNIRKENQRFSDVFRKHKEIFITFFMH